MNALTPMPTADSVNTLALRASLSLEDVLAKLSPDVRAELAAAIAPPSNVVIVDFSGARETAEAITPVTDSPVIEAAYVPPVIEPPAVEAPVAQAEEAPATVEAETIEAGSAPSFIVREYRTTVDRQAFAAAVASAMLPIERRNTIPVLSNVALFGNGDGELYVIGSDLDMEVRATVNVAAIDPGFAVTLPAHSLHSILKKGAGDSVTICVTETRYSTTNGLASINAAIECGPSAAKLPGITFSDFPNLVVGDFHSAVTLPAYQLGALIADVEFAVSTEETRYYLNGAYLHTYQRMGSDHLRLVATDGHRLSMIDFPPCEMRGPFPGAIIPSKALTIAIKQFGTKAPKARKGQPEPTPAMVAVEISDTKARFTVGGTVITTKLVDGTYPDYHRVVPDGNSKRLTVEADYLAAAVARVSVVASERGRIVKFSLADSTFTLSVHNPDSGTTSEVVPCEYTSDDLEIGFNSLYLREALERFKGETVTFRLEMIGSPAIIEGRKGGPTTVLMPVRI